MADTTATGAKSEPSELGMLIFSWAWVSVPLAWGVYNTVIKSLALFHG